MQDERNNDIQETAITGVTGPITGWLDGHTILVGLLANPIRHSVSPTMHNNAFAKLGLNGLYLCFEVEGDRLEGAVKAIRTLGMRIAKEAGVKHIYNGLGMVVGQGAEPFKLWTGKEMPVDYIKEIVAKA